MALPLIFDFIETLSEELSRPGGPVDAASVAAFGVSPVIATGSLYSDGNDLNEEHAPFIEIYPGSDAIELELYRLDESGYTAAPRAFSLGVRIGLRIDGPGELPPRNPATQSGPILYASGHGRAGEAFALRVIAALVDSCAAHGGYIPTGCSGVYDGARDFPLETYVYELTFGVPRTTGRGAY